MRRLPTRRWRPSLFICAPLIPRDPLAACAFLPQVVADLRVTVTNVGQVPGSEVVQLYVAYPPAAGEPPLVLRAFAKTGDLAPQASRTVSLELSRRDLSVWATTTAGGGWQPVRGAFELHVGSSSRDLRLHHAAQF